jgi:hypothetical protein
VTEAKHSLTAITTGRDNKMPHCNFFLIEDNQAKMKMSFA